MRVILGLSKEIQNNSKGQTIRKDVVMGKRLK